MVWQVRIIASYPDEKFCAESQKKPGLCGVFLMKRQRRGTAIAVPVAEVRWMKKLFALLMTITILAAVAVPAFGQGRTRRCNNDYRTRTTRTYYNGYPNDYRTRTTRTYYNNSYYGNQGAYYDYSDQYRGRSTWSRHRDKLTLAIGTGAGAAIGGLIGGKRGAVIGALSGLGGSALYTYKLRNRRVRF